MSLGIASLISTKAFANYVLIGKMLNNRFSMLIYRLLLL
jgi:hypothetical protein